MGQEVVVYVLVGLAAANLARIWSGSLRSKGGCGKCGGCASDAAKPKPAAPQLVQLQMNLKSKDK